MSILLLTDFIPHSFLSRSNLYGLLQCVSLHNSFFQFIFSFVPSPLLLYTFPNFYLYYIFALIRVLFFFLFSPSYIPCTHFFLKPLHLFCLQFLFLQSCLHFFLLFHSFIYSLYVLFLSLLPACSATHPPPSPLSQLNFTTPFTVSPAGSCHFLCLSGP